MWLKFIINENVVNEAFSDKKNIPTRQVCLNFLNETN